MYITMCYYVHYYVFHSLQQLVTITPQCKSLQLGLQLGGVMPFQFQFRAYVGQGVQLGLLAGSGVGPIEHHLGRWGGVCAAPSPRAMKVGGGAPGRGWGQSN